MTTPIVAGPWLLTHQRLAIHLPTRTAVVADLHLGYHEARQARGDAIPAPPLESQLAPIRQAQWANDFRRLVVAGDLFEHGFRPELCAGFVRFLQTIGVVWTALVRGNHDRRIQEADFPCPVLEDWFALDDWRVIHGDRPIPEGNVVMGHWHPCWAQGRQRWPCFLASDRLLVLPAFSTNAAGVPVQRDRRWGRLECWAIQNDRLARMAPRTKKARQGGPFLKSYGSVYQ